MKENNDLIERCDKLIKELDDTISTTKFLMEACIILMILMFVSILVISLIHGN